MTTVIILITDGVIVALAAVSFIKLKEKYKNKKRGKREIKVNKDIFKNEAFVRQQEVLLQKMSNDAFIKEQGNISYVGIDQKPSRDEKSRMEYFDSYNKGYGIIKDKVKERERVDEDLATKSATSFEHGGLDINNGPSNYFNI